MSIEGLADVLIASRCGTHSLGLVYEFLLNTVGSPKEARAHFVRFLSGELPPRLLKEAQLWISEEQGWENSGINRRRHGNSTRGRCVLRFTGSKQ